MSGRMDITYVAPVAPGAPAALPLNFWVRKLRAVILALMVVFVVRAVFVEPFGVPTGSMALEILGLHRGVACQNCGASVRVGEPDDGGDAAFFRVACPNCGSANLHLADADSVLGDRLFVDKSAFEWRAPSRWNLAVFRKPSDLGTPFVKRIVGLPGETVSIRDGDVTINGALARKTLTLALAVAVPVTTMQHQPAQGWGDWWHREPPQNREPAPRVEGTTLVLPRSDDSAWHGLAFHLPNHEPIGDTLAYNGRRPDLAVDWVHDFLLVCDCTAIAGDGKLRLAVTDGADTASVTLSPTANAVIAAGDDHRPAPGSRLRLGTTHRIHLAFVDRRVTVLFDGALVDQPVDLPPAINRFGVVQPVKVQVQNLEATIRNLSISRDLHYRRAGRLGGGQCRLADDEYFMLGDNSGNSDDSRFWSPPGVPAWGLIGRPVFLYAATDWSTSTFFGRSWRRGALNDGRFGWIR